MELNTIAENSETKNSDGEKNEVRFSISLPRASELGNLTKKEEEEGGCSVQLLCGLAISLVALLQGASISSSAIFVVLVNEHPEDLKDQPDDLFDFGLNLAGKDFPLTKDEDSWVASIWILSHLIFAPVAGFVNDKIGRRRALMIDNVFLFLGFTILTFAPSFPWLMIARILMGCPSVSQVNIARGYLYKYCQRISLSTRGTSPRILYSTEICKKSKSPVLMLYKISKS